MASAKSDLPDPFGPSMAQCWLAWNCQDVFSKTKRSPRRKVARSRVKKAFEGRAVAVAVFTISVAEAEVAGSEPKSPCAH